ncbi:MAG: hypothetical protein K8F92_19145 [Hyphomicrobium sp.]|uniref:hypothetical protein n=1 Tax=Hyphomicrobium sp. TaxID=82 RepID=UPI0025BF637C|nr:hypothetical protein [Hyphomicrobium sp.]MBZ0211749.1 hypothetical protein [Hyphomicrobium sp.]
MADAPRLTTCGSIRRNRVGLAHRRLLIVDLSPLGLPSRSGRFGVIYNGEVFNFERLRHRAAGGRLQLRGWLRSRSDHRGLRGPWRRGSRPASHRHVFAFALWDSRERVLYLVRDRLDIKPLYWSLSDRQQRFLPVGERGSLLF